MKLFFFRISEAFDNFFARLAWKMWGRRLAIRQVRKLIEEANLPPPTPYYSIEITSDSNRDDAGLN